MSKTQKQIFSPPDEFTYIRSIHAINDYGNVRLSFLGNNNKRNEYHVEREFYNCFLQEEKGMLAQEDKLLRIKPSFNFKYMGKLL